MILDKLEHIGRYLPAYENEIKEFIATVSSELPDGKYDIIGDDIFAKVMSYETKPHDSCAIESHDKYIDIQSTIIGMEGIGVYDREVLEIDIPYENENDITFYKKSKPHNHIVIPEKYFVILFPHEAHSPQMKVDSCRLIKKFVIKVKKVTF